MGNREKNQNNISKHQATDKITWFEENVGCIPAGKILTLATDQVTIGDPAQDVDLKIFLGASAYALFDAGASTVTLSGLDVTLTGDLTIDTEDLALGDNDTLEFGDGTDVTFSWDGDSLNILPATDDTGRIEIGNGTKDMDLIWFGGAAGDYVEFEVGAKTLDLVNIVQTITNTTASAGAYTGLYTTITTGLTHTGNVAGMRSIVQTDNTGDSIANIFALMCKGMVRHASDVVTGTLTGLLCQVDLGAVSNSNSCNAWAACLEFVETGTRAKIPVAFIRFTDYDYDGSAPVNYLFDLGGTGNQFPSGSGKIHYNDTLWIRFNGTDKYIPLSTAEGTYTTAYPIVLTATTSSAGAYTGVYTTITTGQTHTGNVAGMRSIVQTDNSGDSIANIFAIMSRAKLQHASDTVTGTMTALLAQIDMGAVSNSNAANAWGICIDHLETGTRDKIPCAFIRFTDQGYAGSAPTNYLFDLGATGNEFPTGTGKIFYNNTLRIRVNSADQYIALSSAESSYTTAYPIVSTCVSDGMTITAGTLAVDGRIAKFSGTSATPAMSDGYGAVEIDTTVSGTATGWFSALSSWVNITGDGAIGANFVCAQQNGIYADAGANTGSIVIFGMRAQAMLTDAPTVLAPFSINTSNRAITALFEMSSNPDVGYVANAGETGLKVGDVPLFCDNNGQQYFVRIYSARG